MNQEAAKKRRDVLPERLKNSGFLLGAILFHLILFSLFATWIIWPAPKQDLSTADFQRVSIHVPPPVQPPSSGATANNPQFEPQPVTVPVVTPAATISTLDSSFKVTTSKVIDQSLSHLADKMPAGSGLDAAGAGTTTRGGNAFGTSSGSSNQLTGYFYDLKQTSDKKPTGLGESQYLELLAKYVSRGWDDSLLEPYYKSKAPLYTDVYAISTRPSDEAPKAFGLENEVQPGLWVVHYHATVEAPQAGDYRFIGFADNVMVVKIRGETVLDGGWDSLSSKPILHQLLPYALPSYIKAASPGHNPQLKMGPTFRLDAADPVEMDVLIGDCGGVCSFFLLIEKEGNTYEKTADGTPKYPFFQISAKAAPTFSDSEEHPPYTLVAEPWKPQ